MRNRFPRLLLIFLGAMAGGASISLFSHPTQPVGAEPSPLPAAPANFAPATDSFDSIVAKLAPSVVAIDAVKSQVASTSNKGKPQEESGSGVLLQFDGYKGTIAVTNNHVISGAKAKEITVTLNDGRILTHSRLVGSRIGRCNARVGSHESASCHNGRQRPRSRGPMGACFR